MAGQALLELVLVFDLMGNCMLRLMSPVWPSCIRLCGILRAIVSVHCVIAVCQSAPLLVVDLDRNAYGTSVEETWPRTRQVQEAAEADVAPAAGAGPSAFCTICS